MQALRIREAIERLPDNPRLGRAIPVPDDGEEELRELVLSPYVIRYTVEADCIVVVRLWHGREE